MLPAQERDCLKIDISVTILERGIEEPAGNFVSRLSRVAQGENTITGLTLEPSLDSNRIAVISPSGKGFIFDQLSGEPWRDFCTKIGASLRNEGMMGVLIITDRTVPKEHVGVIKIK